MISVTGATGHLGRLVVEDLLERSVEPSDIIAAVRSPDKAEDLAAWGVEIRYAEYTDPDSLQKAFEGVEHLLLISSSEVGRRVEHHRYVVEAATKAGVGHLVYTSMLRADRSPMQLAAEHKATEEIIEASGIPYTFLRNGWYIENYTENLDPALEHGVLLGSSADGRISAATRADFAAAAAAVLTEDGHEGALYELGGDEAFTMEDLADEISRQSGTGVVYRDLPVEEYEQVLVDAGLPASYAAVLADSSAHIADGHLYVENDNLSRLIGRPTTRLSEAVEDALSVTYSS